MKYIIAAIPRSGSSLLGEYLVATNSAGIPREFLNLQRLEENKDKYSHSEIELPFSARISSW